MLKAADIISELQLNRKCITCLLNIIVKHPKRTALKEFLEHRSNFNSI